MALGIFGDSFAYEGVMNQKYETHPNIEQVGSSWVTHLRNDFDIENHSVKGCEPFYMYKKFSKEHSNYDKVIFVFPRPGRISTKVDDKEIHIPHIFNVESLVNSAKSEKEKELYLAYKGWHDHLYNDHKESFYTNLIKREILRIRPDTFIMYGSNWKFKDKTSPIIHISYQENDKWNESFWTIRDKYIDLRFNHMTKENNILLYKFVLDCINKNQKIKIDPKTFDIPSDDSKYTYLIDKE